MLCGTSLSAAEKKRFVLYAMLKETVPVKLADGAKWVMAEGDTFPLLMYKEDQTKVVLQLAGTNFMVNASSVQVIAEKAITEAQMETYRQNVKTYLDSQTEAWKAQQSQK